MVRTKFHSLVLCMLGTVFVKLQHIRHPLTGIMQMLRNLAIEVNDMKCHTDWYVYAKLLMY